jgi:lauroyl/myristoyl acyltransferase
VIRVRPPVAQLPLDLARVAFEETARGSVPLDEPEILRFLSGSAWRMLRRLTPARDAVTADEVRRSFRVNVRTAGAIVREAHDVALQARLETLLLPRMDAAQIARIVRVEGAVDGPAIVVTPHAGNLLLLATVLARRTPGLVVFGARGLPPTPPPGVSAVRRTRLNGWITDRRLAEENRLPIRWEDAPEALDGWLARGAVVLVAFDDRAWTDYTITSFLGREALLSPQPWALAARTGVRVVPARIWRERDKSNHVVLGSPIAPDLGGYLASEAEPFLRANPGHYGTWLAECRIRASLDDHPLFLDYAPDERWRRWSV